MSDNITGPIEVQLSEEDVQDLKDGETVSIVLEERGNWKDQLEIQWKSVGEFGESGKEFVDNLKEALTDD